MGWWKSKASHSHAVQLLSALHPSGPVGSAGRGRHTAVPRARLETLENCQLGRKAHTLWSFLMQRWVGPTENVKPSPRCRVQSTELHPWDESHSPGSGAASVPCQAHEATSLVPATRGWKARSVPWGRPWHLGLPRSQLSFQEGGFWEGKTGDWRPVAHSCAPPASHPGEQAPVLELTLQTWHTDMPASPGMNPSWISTGLLCSPVVQPWAQANKSSFSFLS